MKTETYKPKTKYIQAIQYNGTVEMAKQIEEHCPYSYIEWDEAENFCGLRGFSEWGIDNCTSEYVEEGDYLVWENDRYILYPQKEFESNYDKTK